MGAPTRGDNDRTRVLIVDDHTLFAQALAAALSTDADVDVIGTAASLAEADRALSRQPADVVLLDYRLPDGTGLDALEVIKRLAPLAAVVMVTANEDERVLLAAVEAGCAGFILKTGDLHDVQAAVKRAANGEASISPVLLTRLLRRLGQRDTGVGSDLTRRETDILRQVVSGRSNADIADDLVLSVHTVRNHVQNVLAKLGAHSKLEAAAIAVREGLVNPLA